MVRKKRGDERGKEKRRDGMRRPVLLSSLVALPLLPGAARKVAELEGRRKGFEVRQFKLTTRDGTRLSAALYVPGGEGPFPALVMVHSWMLSRWQCHLYAPYFASAGYVVLTYDCRGWGSSRGKTHCADPELELRDLEEAIDWLTRDSGLPLKEGAVGITGISYGGGHSFLIASRDPRVKAAAPINGWTDLRESLLPQGSLKIFWGMLLLLTASCATRLDPRNPLYRWTGTMLLRRGDAEAFEEDMRRRSRLQDAENIDTPMLIVGSWNDDLFEPNQMMHFYERLRSPKMLYIANGIHGLDAGFGPRWAGKDIWALIRRWFDHWLKGEDNGMLEEPPVRLYRPWKKTVEPEESWPPPGVTMHRLFLGDDDGALKMSSRPGEGKGELDLKPRLLSPASSGPSVVRPQALGFVMPGPGRDRGRGYFSFTTAPSRRDFELIGIPRLTLAVEPRQERVQVNALLYDVPPHGRLPRLITYGTATLEGLRPGEEHRLSMELVAADYLLEVGHSFRLTLTGTNLSFVLPVLGKGARIIYGEGKSFLELPLREVGIGA
ncbi:MAG: CocE/NonD family hydrolase [Actinobacteria bacterium]|nr:CocE/NonD family hydrolase [Actinomycetota bacterium]MDI6830455.1 CocE/NonD family hydrolase [Actinomycetota bacterium]